MTPNFALSLSFQGIRLLQRATDGWRLVGEVSLEAEDLPGALSVLLDTAKSLAPQGVSTKIIIPNEQIRYLTIDTGSADDAARWVAARAALDGATPYAVSDLAFDLVADGTQTHIAAIAQETLSEAEAFAEGYGFAPISFVATPDPDSGYPAEPFFGETVFARRTFGPALTVERDQDILHVVGPVEQPSTTPVEEPHAGRDEDVTASPTDDAFEPTEPHFEVVAPEAFETGPEPANLDNGYAIEDAEVQQDAAPEPRVEDMPAAATQEDDVSTAEIAADVAESEDDVPQVSFKSVARAREADEETRSQEGPAPVGFVSRRIQKQDESRPTLGGVTRNRPDISIDAPSLPQDERRAEPIAQAPAATAAASLVPQKPAMGARAQAIALAAHRPEPAEPAPAATMPDEAARMTVFGAREASHIGGKPRYLGLMLTAGLVVFLAGVAAWSSVFSKDGMARLFSPREEPALAAPIDTPLTLPDPLATEEAPEPDREVAALDPTLTDEDAAVLDALRDAQVDPLPPIAEDPEAYYTRTGIWSVSPDIPRPVALVPLDGLYEPSIDRGAHQRESHDAVALQIPATRRTDTVPLPFSSPAAPGIAFRLDPRGLVIPTPEGVLNPDGVRVYAGKPPKVPPTTPDRSTRRVEELDPRIQALAGVRPRSRPSTLLEDNERANQTGPARAELAIYRPVARPALERTPEETAAEQPDAPATAEAVQISRRPDARPKNFDRIVARAAPPQAQPAAVRIPRRTVTPNIPTSASVAREATLRNAIDFRRINLIGVYGTPSDRRALVLLSNGRYKKVKVGDALDGGRVSAIGDSELRYQKRGRNLILKMPKG